MERLDDTDIASIPTNPHHFQEQMQYLSKEDANRLARQTKITTLQQKIDLAWTIEPLVFFRNISVSEIWNHSQEIPRFAELSNPVFFLIVW